MVARRERLLLTGSIVRWQSASCLKADSSELVGKNGSVFSGRYPLFCRSEYDHAFLSFITKAHFHSRPDSAVYGEASNTLIVATPHKPNMTCPVCGGVVEGEGNDRDVL